MAHQQRIMYIENKAQSMNGAARIGRVKLSKTGLTVYYDGKEFARSTNFAKANYFDVATGEPYWISGPRKDGADRLYASNLPIYIDDDVREEYWCEIRDKPEMNDSKVVK
jgi:hypothetical protein